MVTAAESSKAGRVKKAPKRKRKTSPKPLKAAAEKPASELKRKLEKEKKKKKKPASKPVAKKAAAKEPAETKKKKKTKKTKKVEPAVATTTSGKTKKSTTKTKRSRSYSLSSFSSSSSSSSSSSCSPPPGGNVLVNNVDLNNNTIQLSISKPTKGTVKGSVKGSSKGKKSSPPPSNATGFSFGGFGAPPDFGNFGKGKGKGFKKGFGKQNKGEAVRLPKATPVSYEMVIEEVHKMDAILKDEKILTSSEPIVVQEDEFRDALFEACYNNILSELSKERYQSRYGCNQHDLYHFNIQPKQQVPSYFANVQNGSIYERKILSLLGLRNLVYFGPKIFSDLQQTLFSSDPEIYGPGVGVSLMKQMTGNAVDLDTCVLRCSDGAVLKVVNSLNSKSSEYPTYGNSSDFGSSVQAREMAVSAARPMLEAFCKDMKLSKQQMDNRRVNPSTLSSKSIPLATHNTDRGKFPLWQYVNVGQNSFHANVPCLPDVVGSLLLSPYHLMLCFSTIMTRPEQEREKLLDDFFEDCVVDACFNLKWKAIEEFLITLSSFDTISSALAECERLHQPVFNKIFDNDDTSDEQKNTEESSALWELVKGKYARDEKTNTTRAITRSDIDSWIEDPMSLKPPAVP